MGELARKYNNLDKYVKEIGTLYSGIKTKWTTSLDDAIRVGELLTKCKMNVAHGDWMDWVKENLPFSDTSAKRYIRTYGRRAELKTATVAELIEDGWARALDDLGEKSQQVRKVTEPEVVEGEVVEPPKQVEYKQEDKEVLGPIESKEWAVRTKILPNKWAPAIKNGVGEVAVRILDSYIDKHLEGVGLQGYTHINFTLSVQIVGKKKATVKRK